MTSIKWIVAITCLVIVQANPDDHGPQIFRDASPSAPLTNQRGYVMKEVTLYLTPSQIKALEASKGGKDLGETQRLSEHDLQKLEADIKRQLEKQHIYINDQSDIQRPDSNFYNIPPPQVQEPINEPQEVLAEYQQKWRPIPKAQDELQYFTPIQENNEHNLNTKLPSSYSFVKIFTDEKVHETPKLQLFHPIPHQHHHHGDLSKLFEIQRDPLRGKQYKLIPYEYLPDHSPGAPKPEEVKEITKLVTELDKYETPLSVSSFLNSQIINKNKNRDEKLHQSALDYFKEEPYLKYAPNFDEHKHAAEYQNFVIKLEKDNAFSRAEAILNPSLVLRKGVLSKRRTASGNKHLSYFSAETSPVLRHVRKH